MGNQLHIYLYLCWQMYYQSIRIHIDLIQYHHNIVMDIIKRINLEDNIQTSHQDIFLHIVYSIDQQNNPKDMSNNKFQYQFLKNQHLDIFPHILYYHNLYNKLDLYIIKHIPLYNYHNKNIQDMIFYSQTKVNHKLHQLYIYLILNDIHIHIKCSKYDLHLQKRVQI